MWIWLGYGEQRAALVFGATMTTTTTDGACGEFAGDASMNSHEALEQ
jgi:hypothetical protein